LMKYLSVTGGQSNSLWIGLESNKLVIVEMVYLEVYLLFFAID